MAAPYKAWVCGRSPAEIVGSNPTGGKDVCLLWVLLGRCLCDELITRPEESYRLWCVIVCDLETSWMRRPWPALGRSDIRKKNFDPFSSVESPFRWIHISAVHHSITCLKGSDVSSVFHVSCLEIWTEFKCNVKLYNKIKTKFLWRSDNHWLNTKRFISNS